MNKFILLTLFFLLTFFVTPLVFAQEMNSGERVVLPKSAVVNSSYFTAGNNVTIDGTVNGDVYAGGGEVLVGGTINGDLLVAGGNVFIQGTVAHNVRVAGGNITISGKIGGNVTAGGGNVTVTNSADIKGDVVAGSGNLEILGPVGQNIVAGGGNISIDQKVGGNVVVGTNALKLGSSAIIAGNLTYYSGQRADIQQGAVVNGETNFHQSAMAKQNQAQQAAKAAGSAWLFFKLINFASSLILGLILISLAPVFCMQTVSQLQKNLWASMGIGFLILIVTPITAFILAITLIGLPLAFFVIFLYFLIMYISKIFISLWIGLRVVGYWQKKPHVAWSFAAGLALWIIITSIPLIGGLLAFLSLITGLGALFLQKKATFTSLRAKKLI